MIKKIFFHLSCIIGILFTSCASKYNSIETLSIPYIKGYDAPLLEINYQDNIYSLTDNTKYAKREQQKGYKLLVLEIINKGLRPVTITSEKFRIYDNNKQVEFIDQETYYKNIRQYSGSFLLHGLWGPWFYYYKDTKSPNGSRKTTSTFIYLPVGLTIGIINTVRASKANKMHRENIQELNLFGKTINPNEKVCGYICVELPASSQLRFEYDY